MTHIINGIGFFFFGIMYLLMGEKQRDTVMKGGGVLLMLIGLVLVFGNV